MLAESIDLFVSVVVLSALMGVTPPMVALEPISILSKPSITAAEAPVPSSNNNLALPLVTLTVAPEPCLTVIVCPPDVAFSINIAFEQVVGPLVKVLVAVC